MSPEIPTPEGYGEKPCKLHEAGLPQADVDLVIELRPEFESARRSEAGQAVSET